MGFLRKTQGDPARKITEVEKILFVQKGKSLPIHYFYAKNGTKKDLLCHLYETGAIAKELLANGYLKPIAEKIAYLADEEVNDVINIITFLAAVHDIGKFHPDFQIWILGREDLTEFGYGESSNPCRHEQYGSNKLSKWLVSLGCNKNLSRRLAETIYIHHQGHKKDNYFEVKKDKREEIEILINNTLLLIKGKFDFKVDVFEKIVEEEENVNGVFSFISAIINFSDWIASSYGVFDEKSYDDFNTENDYFWHLKKQAEYFSEKNFLNSYNVHTMFDQYEDPFLGIFGITSKRPLQETVYKITKHANENPTMYLIEDACGAGKTESALSIIAKQDSNGFYIALPTNATANAMGDRIQRFMDSTGEHIKVPVFTGTSWMSEKDINIEKECWLHPGRQKMFYPFAVGTVDQLIASVQKVKYGLLRLLAISNKTIVIDEMHAYDAYMLQNIEEFLLYCGWLGVNVIILSATLPLHTKKRLIGAYTNNFKKARNYKYNAGYPLITRVSFDAKQCYDETPFKIEEYTCDPAFKKDYHFEFCAVLGKDQNKEIAEIAKKKIEGGGCLAIILNTVKAVQELYDYISLDSDFDDCDVVLKVHAKYTQEKKDAVTETLNTKYGKSREKRPEKSIVISTQVIEQSLDVDFDYMLTEIAPIDLLIQRFGRKNRHDDKGTIREFNKSKDRIVILTPKIKNQFGSTENFYNRQILIDTISQLDALENRCLSTPDNVRDIIDNVYTKENIETLKNIQERNSAIGKIISGPYASEFEYYTMCVRSDFESLQTRFETYKSYDIAIIDAETAKKITAGESVSIEDARKIMRKNVIKSIACWELEDNNGNCFFDDSEIKITSGYLSDVRIFLCDKDGFVYGKEGKKMTIMDGEYFYYA